MNKDTSKKKNEAKSRVITGIFIVVVIVAVLLSGNTPTAVLFALIALLGGYEIGKMSWTNHKYQKYLHVLISVLPFFIIRWTHAYIDMRILILLTVLMHIFLIIDLYKTKYLPYKKISYLLAFFYWGLPFGLAAHILLKDGGHIMVLGLIILIWVSDSMAYFTGKRFGKRKLFPRISPGKTWEGTIGGGFFSIIASVIFALVNSQSIEYWIGTAIVVWITGNYGDLVESKIKRALMFKDSGNILPGHGGILDRFDSFVYAIGFMLFIYMNFK